MIPMVRGSYLPGAKGNRRRRQAVGPGLAAAATIVAAILAQAAWSQARSLEQGLAEARTLEKKGQYDQAIRRYRELWQQFPDSPEIWRGLAEDLVKTGRCEEVTALESGSAAAGRASSKPEAAIGACYFRRNDLQPAVAHLQKAVEQSPDDKQATIYLGRAYASNGQLQEAVRVLKAFQARRGDDPDVLYWIGTFYDELAERTYQTMAKSYPTSYLVLETQGDQFLQQQKYDAALEAYQRALSAAPAEPGLHFDLGNTYWHMAKLDRARTELETELKLNPGHAQANYELGDIDVKQGETEKAVVLLKKALALEPNLIEAHRSLGRAYLSQRLYPEAAHEFSLVAEAEPSDHAIHALLATVYQRMGRAQEAEAETQKYNELVKQQMSDLERKESEQNRNAKSAPATPPN
jgi:tetratricopeptide (TPR) repeat protein